MPSAYTTATEGLIVYSATGSTAVSIIMFIAAAKSY
jgi:hypothetical protein